MACDSKTFKDEVTGMEDSSLQKEPRWEELEERWAPFFEMVPEGGFCSFHFTLVSVLWFSICLALGNKSGSFCEAVN